MSLGVPPWAKPAALLGLKLQIGEMQHAAGILSDADWHNLLRWAGEQVAKIEEMRS